MGNSPPSPPRTPLPLQQIVDQVRLSAQAAPSSPVPLRDSPRSVHMRKEKFPIILTSDPVLNSPATLQLGIRCESRIKISILLHNKPLDKVIERAGAPDGQLATFSLPNFPNQSYFASGAPLMIHIATEDGHQALQLHCGFTEVPGRAPLVEVRKKGAVIGGQLLELENIYGLAGTQSVCLICMQSEVTVALAPCRHACLCEECASEFARISRTVCPICRVQATGLMRLSLTNPPKE